MIGVVFVTFLILLWRIEGTQVLSKCLKSETNVLNGSHWNCADGSILLLGDYLNLGLHPYGSLGSDFISGVPYYSSPFGVLADFNELGFFNNFFAGDYISPGTPIEGKCERSVDRSIRVVTYKRRQLYHSFLVHLGWMLQYKIKNTFSVPQNFGYLGFADITPVQFSITTNDSALSAMWIGRNSQMEVRQVYTMDLSSLQVQVSMSIKNIGTSAASSLYCKSVPHLASPSLLA